MNDFRVFRAMRKHRQLNGIRKTVQDMSGKFIREIKILNMSQLEMLKIKNSLR